MILLIEETGEELRIPDKAIDIFAKDPVHRIIVPVIFPVSYTKTCEFDLNIETLVLQGDLIKLETPYNLNYILSYIYEKCYETSTFVDSLIKNLNSDEFDNIKDLEVLGLKDLTVTNSVTSYDYYTTELSLNLAVK